LSNVQYRVLAETIPGITWEYNIPDDRWTYVSPQAKNILGYAPEEWSDLEWWLARMHAEDREWAPAYCHQLTARGEDHSFEYRFTTKDGRTVWLSDNVSVEMRDNQPVMMRGIMLDITASKRTELRERSRLTILEKIATNIKLEEQLECLVHFIEQECPGALCSVLLANESGTHLLHGVAPSLPDFYNQAINGLKIGQGMGSCGTAAFLHKRVVVEDIEGHPYWKGFKAAQEAELRACWSEPILSPKGELLGTFATYHRTPCSPNREEIVIIESTAHLASIAIGRARDDEKRHNLEEQLRHMQKIDAIGQLTGGIAHDFNNMITPIFVYAEMIKRTLAEDDPNLKKLNCLISSAHKAKELTQKLLSFSRKQKLEKNVLDLNEVVASLQELLRRTIRDNIVIEARLTAETAHVFADRGQLEQVLVNLAVNAQDAIAVNGRISLQTGHVMLDDEYVKMHPGMKSGAHILLSFSDNGCGMSDEVLSHLFEPFYTTKTVGHGTGLGLATAYGIIKQHDGYLQVKSRVGEGTTFTIYLPEHRDDSKPLSAPHTETPQISEKMNNKTILIVDDNTMLLEMAVELLESDGYNVLCADSPLKARTIAHSQGASLDLLVTDVVMPESSGPELYRQLAAKSPKLPVLYISGYTFDVKLQNDSQNGKVKFLPKPFTSQQFLNSVQQALKHTI